MTKNIALCFDGTGNVVRREGNTNVLLLFRRIDYDPERQLTYYDPGVGTFSAAGASTPFAQWFSRLLGQAFGAGLRTNLEEAYTFLMNHWNPGDEIYIFGFSRGAYTARAMAGLLAGRDHPARWREPGPVRRPITPAGTRSGPMTSGSRRGSTKTPSGAGSTASTSAGDVSGRVGHGEGAGAAAAQHDLAGHARAEERGGRRARGVDRREAASLPRVSCRKEKAADRIDEVWFAGVHSDVGGSYTDPPRSWRHHPELDRRGRQGGRAGVSERSARGRSSPRSTPRAHPQDGPDLGIADQPAPPDTLGAKVHASVRSRIEKEPRYARRRS